MGSVDGQTNVKSIMAKFSPSNNPAEEVHSRQVRVAGQSSLATKAAFEKFSHLENAGPPARPSTLQKSPSFRPPLGLKPSLQETPDKEPKPPPLKSSPAANKFAALAQATSRELNEKVGFPKPLGPRPTEILKEDSKPVFSKIPDNRLHSSALPTKNDLRPSGLKPNFKSELQETPEAKPVFQKLAGVKETFITASQENDPKPLFPKAVLKPRPSLTPHPANSEDISNKNVSLNQAPPPFRGSKPKTHSFKSPRGAEEKSTSGVDSSPIPVRFPVSLKPVSNQNYPPHGLPKSYGQQNEETRPNVTKDVFRTNHGDSGSPSAPAKFVPSRVATSGPWANNLEKEEKNLAGPKRKTIPPPFKLGPAPAKPSRPPVVDLARFQKDNKDSSNESHSVPLPSPLPPPISAIPPPPPPPPASASHPSAQAPVLPPRNIKPRSDARNSENEENYDDVDVIDGPGNSDESGEEMYEDIDVRHASKDRERKREKLEEKKSDQEKKEQKEQREKEKKEQEMRKKFKLVGPIEILHQARACTDYKGGKNELTFKQGDNIEIIRITDNPEGKWLGRIRGSYGYIKTTMVEIDYDSLKRKPRPLISTQPKQPDSDQEVYDDVGDQDSIGSGGQSATGVTFPPPPTPDEIYDGVDDDDVPTSSPLTKQSGKDSGDSDVYDDVEPSDFPPPPKIISQGINTKPPNFGKNKSEDRDSQKAKKMEKEEKEFRKKFKFEGDIRVLYSTTIMQAPSPKKKASKDLLVKPGDSVDVIKDVDATKVLCRNEEGKYGYVLKSCLLNDDEEIYDDIGEDCIYDND